MGAAWDAGFEKMLAFAGKMGWIDPSGSMIKAHTEWPTCNGENLWQLVEARAADLSTILNKWAAQ